MRVSVTSFKQSLFFGIALVGISSWMVIRGHSLIQPGVTEASSPANLFQDTRQYKATLNDEKSISNSPASRQVNEAYHKLPLSFEVNQSPADSAVRFISRGDGYSLLLTPTEALLIAQNRGRQGKGGGRLPATTQKVLKMKLTGANPASRISGLDALPGKSNYFIGNDPAKWRTNVMNFARVKYDEVYPGIDLIYYGNQRQLEYDLVVAPGADPKAIRLAYEGARELRFDADGNLILGLNNGEFLQHKPVIYQEVNGQKQPVAGRYARRGCQEVGFEIASYDTTRPLVIDPKLDYWFHQGSDPNDVGKSIAVDNSGNAYVTGQVMTAIEIKGDAYDMTKEGNLDAFVMKLRPAASGTSAELVYSTYLGGSGDESGNGIALDANGNVYVTGETSSMDFPLKNQFQTKQVGRDAFVIKLNLSGMGMNQLVYSTYLGGTGEDIANSIAAGANGVVFVTGSTLSSDFPVKNALPTSFAYTSLGNAFVTKLDTAQSGDSSLSYSTYLGGNDVDIGYGIAADAAGNAYVTGRTESSNFPTTVGAFQPEKPTFLPAQLWDAFLTKISTDASGMTALAYSTYLGGSDQDEGHGIALDGNGKVYLTGWTTPFTTSNVTFSYFPTTSGAFQTTYGGIPGRDAFVAKFDLSQLGAASLIYSTYLGGPGDDEGNAIAVDSAGNAYVTGSTTGDFPTKGAILGPSGDGKDVFLTKLNAAGSALIYSTYLNPYSSAQGSDSGNGVAVDTAGSAYVTGAGPKPIPTPCFSGGDASCSQAIQVSPQGMFVAKISAKPNLITLTKTASPDLAVLGSTITYTIKVTNLGTPSSSMVVRDSLPQEVNFFSCVIDPGGFCGIPGTGGNFIVDFSLAPGKTGTITLKGIVVMIPAGGIIRNTATVFSVLGENEDTSDNSAETTTKIESVTINCPPDIFAAGTAGSAGGGIVTYSAPDIMPFGISNLVAMTCTPQSGALFPRGVTTVTCTATSNIAIGETVTHDSCSFKVTVFDASLQDDRSGDYLLFDSFTGDYRFTRCGSGGFTLTGKGLISHLSGGLTRLESPFVKADLYLFPITPNDRGSATIKKTPMGPTFFINDSNVTNNTCVCPARLKQEEVLAIAAPLLSNLPNLKLTVNFNGQNRRWTVEQYQSTGGQMLLVTLVTINDETGQVVFQMRSLH